MYGPLQVYESSSGLRRGSLSEALPVSTEYLIALTVAHLLELELDKAQSSFVLRVSNSVCEKVNVSDRVPLRLQTLCLLPYYAGSLKFN